MKWGIGSEKLDHLLEMGWDPNTISYFLDESFMENDRQDLDESREGLIDGPQYLVEIWTPLDAVPEKDPGFRSEAYSDVLRKHGGLTIQEIVEAMSLEETEEFFRTFRTIKVASTTDGLRIRSVPSLSGEVLGQLEKGEGGFVVRTHCTGPIMDPYGISRDLIEEIDGLRSFWYQILYAEGKTGWVFGGYLDLVIAQGYHD
jgi:uncharacterized protein YgiM (DUF1202 family)